MSYFWTSASLRGDAVYLRGYRGGYPFVETQQLQTYLFVEDPVGEFVTLEGFPCRKQNFRDVREARDFLRKYDDFEDVSNREVMGKVYGLSQFLYTHINDEFRGEVDYDPDLIKRGFIDIETESDGGFPNVETADRAIISITLAIRQGKQRRVLMLGCKPYMNFHKDVTYIMCKDEIHLMETFLNCWNETSAVDNHVWMPDILTGWFIEDFDVPYIVNRIRRILGEEQVRRLSPHRIVKEREITRGQSAGSKTSTQIVYDIYGVSVLDYMQLYKKFSFKNQESYKLDHIAFVELGKRKIDWKEMGYKTLHEFYEKDYQGFLDYNLVDAALVEELDDKCGFLDLVMAFAYDAKVCYNDTMTTTRPWDVIIHNKLLADKIVVPQSLGSSSGGSIVGGYVKEVVPGMYEGVASFDFDSLYPHLIMGWNISPETFLGRVDFDAIRSIQRGTFEQDVAALQPILEEKDAILAGNGCLFSRSRRGFLPMLMEAMYEDRKKYKDLMKEAKSAFNDTKDSKYEKLIARYHNLQLAKKIQLNSGFGALANEYFRWFANYLAEAITMSGQMSTMWTELGVNAFMNKVLRTEGVDYVVAADTDSLYLNMGPLIKSVGADKKTAPEQIEFMDQACKLKIGAVIAKRCQDLTDMVGCPKCKLKMKRENLADKGIWTAKKKYLMNVWDSEDVRYTEPQIKVTGIESVRSSTPMLCRENIKKALKIFIEQDETALQDYIAEFKDVFVTKPFHEVGSPRGISNMEKYRDAANIYAKGTPIQVRGALLFNKLLVDLRLQDKYQPIYDGTKIKFCYLKMPNPIRENVISVPEVLPPEFGLEDFIDYDTQYDKAFVAPLQIIANSIGWNTEKSSSLLDFL